MDHVLHEMQEGSSFKSSASSDKQLELHGTADMTPQNSTEPEAVPDRDGGSTASTSDSSDV